MSKDDTEDSKSHHLRPVSVGFFLQRALLARHLSVEEVAKKTGVPSATLHAIIEGTERLDKTTCNKLARVFKSSKNILLRIQSQHDYFEKHGELKIFKRPIQRAKRRAARAERGSARRPAQKIAQLSH